MIQAFAKVSRLLLLFRLRPFDTSTAEGRSLERYRCVAMTTMSAGLAKGVTALTLFVSVPLTLAYLGSERYGLWMTIGSVVAILSFADFGIGNGLVNVVSEANGRDDRRLAREYVSSAFFMLAALSFVLACVFTMIYPWLSWQRLFNVHSAIAISEAGPAMAVFCGCFLVNIPLGIVNRIQVGYQEGFASNLWTALGGIFALGGVIVVCRLRAGLPWLVLAMAGAPVVATLANAIVLFGTQRRWLRPSWQSANRLAGGKIFRLGMMFFVLQVAVAVGFSSDNVVVAQVLGAGAVTQYSVPAKMFGIITMLITTLLAPLWPAYGEALARQEFGWIMKALKRSIALGLAIAIPANAFLVIFAGRLLHLWVGNRVAPSLFLLVGLALWGVICASSTPVATLLNGAGIMKVQAIVAGVASLTNLGLSVVLTRKFGVVGVCLGSVFTQLLIVFPAYSVLVRNLFRKLKNATKLG